MPGQGAQIILLIAGPGPGYGAALRSERHRAQLHPASRYRPSARIPRSIPASVIGTIVSGPRISRTMPMDCV